MLREADRHLERVIYRAIQDVKLAGRNNTIQNEVAVRTVRWIRPEMTASEALTAGNSFGANVWKTPKDPHQYDRASIRRGRRRRSFACPWRAASESTERG